MGQADAFILYLPDKPVGRQDPTNPHLLAGIAGIAMAHGIDESFVQSELHFLRGDGAGDRLNQPLHQWCQLQRGWMTEIIPAKQGANDRPYSRFHQTICATFDQPQANRLA